MRNIAGSIFRGENIDPGIWEECRGREWSFWVALFLPLINNRHGYFQHLPYSGGYLEQPGTTMRILQAVQGVYFEYLAKKNEVGG